MTLLVTVIATFLSMFIGVTAAYAGGATDRVLDVIIDVFLILPVLPLLILLASYLPPGHRLADGRPVRHQLGVSGAATTSRRGCRFATATSWSRPRSAASDRSTSSSWRSSRP